MQMEKGAEFSAAIPGAADVMRALRGRGLKIGSCSGYPASVMRRVVERAAADNLTPDCIVASDEVPRARPAPAMALKNVVELGLSDVAACIKVDDTAPGIEEGRRAGMWTVGLLLSGNAAGLTLDEYLGLAGPARDAARAAARAELKPAGPHYVIDTVADLPAVVDDIEARLARGERP